MAKSLRSKSKRAYRRSKREREDSAYATVHAARLARLNARLTGKAAPEEGEEEMADEEAEDAQAEDNSMETDAPKKVSTSGERGSRRESYRASKGWAVHKRKTTFKLGRKGKGQH